MSSETNQGFDTRVARSGAVYTKLEQADIIN